MWPCVQVCLVGQDGAAVLRRLDPIFDPTAIEREVASICTQVWPLLPDIIACALLCGYQGCCVMADA